MKTIKYFALSIGILVLLLVLAPFFIPESTYLDFVIQRLENNYPVKIKVEQAELSIFPFPSVELVNANVKVISDDFENDQLAKVKSLVVSSSWIDLWNKTLPFSVAIDDGTLFVVKNEKQDYSFSLFVPQDNKQTNPTRSEKVVFKGLSLNQVKILRIEPGLNKEVGYDVKSLEFEPQKITPTMITADLNADIEFHGGGGQDLSVQSHLIFDKLKEELEIKNSQVSWADTAYQVSALIKLKDKVAHVGAKTSELDFENESLQFKNQTVDGKADIALKDDKIEIKNGTAQVGGQTLSFSGFYPLGQGVGQISGVAKPLNLKFIRSLLKDPEQIPQMSQVDLSFTYSLLGTANGTLSAHSITFEETEIQNLKTHFSYTPNETKLQNLTGQLYGGQAAGNIVIDTKNQKMQFDVDVKNADFKEIKSVSRHLKGQVNLSLKGGTKIGEKDPLKALDANGSLQTINLDIPQLDLLQKVFDQPVWNKVAQIKKIPFDLSALKTHIKNHPDVKDLQSQFLISKGAIQLKPSSLKLFGSMLNFKGKYYLNNSIDANGTLYLSRSLLEKAVSQSKLLDVILGRSNTFPLPLEVKGALPSVKISLNEKQLFSQFQQAVVRYAAQEAKDKIKGKIKEELKKTQVKDKIEKVVGNINQDLKDTLKDKLSW